MLRIAPAPGHPPALQLVDGRGSSWLTFEYGHFDLTGERLEIKVFGGANVIRSMSNIGSQNAEFVKTFLGREGLEIAGEHLRGVWPRKVQFNPMTGQVFMREIKSQEAKDVFDKEIVRRPRSVVSQETGAVELFD